jgi:serine/threonine protein kinase
MSIDSLANEDAMFKNYEVVRVLGEGSFGKVFLIRNIHTRKKIAFLRCLICHEKIFLLLS